MTRTFTDTEAQRSEVPLMVGLVGPSGGGKTMSALRLASGIQRVTGGDIFFIDTESKRALHYADKFKFRHIEFGAPFSPLDYLAAIEHCARKGAKVVVVDSMSHEHEGPGGVLEMHEAAVKRMAGDDHRKAERVKMLAWSAPKQDRRRLINTVLQLPCSTIFCFRAKEKLKLAPGKEPEPLGWMPIGGEEFIFEMTTCMLLPPGADGVPDWQPRERGSQSIIKQPAQFRGLFAKREPLSESHGEAMALWAKGGDAAMPAAQVAAAQSASVVNNAQRSELAKVVQRAWNVEAFLAWLQQSHGVASTKDIPADKFAAIMEFVESRGFDRATAQPEDSGPPPDDDIPDFGDTTGVEA